MNKAVLYYFVSWQFSERNLIKKISTDKLFLFSRPFCSLFFLFSSLFWVANVVKIKEGKLVFYFNKLTNLLLYVGKTSKKLQKQSE